MLDSIEYLTVNELATFLNCSTSLIHKLKNSGTIPFIKIGTSVRFSKEEVIETLKERRCKNDISYV